MMEQTQWLDRIEASMRRAGLPSEYTQRTRGELADHMAESPAAETDEPSILDQQPNELAAELVQTFRFGSWMRWLPPAVWLLLPLPLTILLPTFYLEACSVFLELTFDLPGSTGMLSDRVITTALFLFWTGKVIAPALGVVLLRSLAKRIAQPWFWTAGLFFLFSFTTAATDLTLELGTWDESEWSIFIGTDELLSLNQLPQALAIALTGLWIAANQRREQLSVVPFFPFEPGRFGM